MIGRLSRMIERDREEERGGREPKRRGDKKGRHFHTTEVAIGQLHLGRGWGIIIGLENSYQLTSIGERGTICMYVHYIHKLFTIIAVVLLIQINNDQTFS